MFLYLGTAFLTFGFIVDTYLNWRQYKKLLGLKKPKHVEKLVSQEEYEKIQLYGQENSRLGFVMESYSYFSTIVMLWFQILVVCWKYCGNVVKHFELTSPVSLKLTRFIMKNYQIILFLVILNSFNMIQDLPFSYYKTFYTEKRFGMSNTTLDLFISDTIKGFFLSNLIMPPIALVLVWIIDYFGHYFYLVACFFIMIINILMMFIYPAVIQPLFNKVTPLEDGVLKTKIGDLAKRIGFPLADIHVIDASKRSTKSNAYFYGLFGKKKIVIYDTLIDSCSAEEIEAVVAHELGHWKNKDTYKLLLANNLQTLIMFYFTGYFLLNPQFYSDFGFSDTPTIVGIMLFLCFYTPIQRQISLLFNIFSRSIEFNADKYAVSLGYKSKLSSALQNLCKTNKSTFDPDPWYSTYLYTHPPIVQRLEALNQFKDE